ncbi:4697_t:CDS:2, partial [Paraglomus occultum]
SQPERIDFSALENDNVDSLLHLENKGRLVFEDFVKMVPSQHFLTTLTKLQRRWNISLEAGCHSLIDAYILEAVEFDPDKKEEKTYDETTDRLAVYPEYYVKPVRISDDLQLTGPIDYITANRKERVFDKLKQGTSIVASPTFCTIEAKEMRRFSAGEGEVLGQMLASAKNADGMRWTFYYVDEEGYYRSKIYTVEVEQGVVLGILRHWVRGQLPSSNFSKGTRKVFK